MEYETIILERLKEPEGTIARVTFNRPEKLNVFNQQMRQEMNHALDELEMDDEVKVVILRGSGRAWSAGFDLTRVGPRSAEGDLEMPKHGERGVGHPDIRTRLRREMMTAKTGGLLLYTKPLIAQVHGFCYGGAFYLSMDCDITIAAEDASIGHMEQRMGFGGSAGNLPMEMNLIGFKRTREAMLTGRVWSGKEAAEIGLVSRAVPADKLDHEAYKTAQLIALQPRDGLMIGKAQAQMAYLMMGFLEGDTQGNLMHMVFQMFSHAPDEFNFVRERRDQGTGKAIAARNARYDSILKS